MFLLARRTLGTWALIILLAAGCDPSGDHSRRISPAPAPSESAVDRFPPQNLRGSYAARFTPEDHAIAGRWKFSIDEYGRVYMETPDGQIVMFFAPTTIDRVEKTMEIRAEPNHLAGCNTTGLYRYRRWGKKLRFQPIEDPCGRRVDMLSGVTWVRYLPY